MIYTVLADLTVAVHLGYVLFVLLGQIAIWIGIVLGWQWIRNSWFRVTHLVMIAVVALEAIIGMECPLTTWELQLRELAWKEGIQEKLKDVPWEEGIEDKASRAEWELWVQEKIAEAPGEDEETIRNTAWKQWIEERSFVTRIMRRMLFFNCPTDNFMWIYIGFGILVAATFVFFPPRWRKASPADPPSSGQGGHGADGGPS